MNLRTFLPPEETAPVPAPPSVGAPAPGLPDGTRWQRAGTFAVDGDGIVRWRHLPDHAGALPDLRDAALTLSG